MVLHGTSFPNVCQKLHVPTVDIFIHVGIEICLSECSTAVVLKRRVYLSRNKLCPHQKGSTYSSGDECKHNIRNLKFRGACTKARLEVCIVPGRNRASTDRGKDRVPQNSDNRRVRKRLGPHIKILTVRTLKYSVALTKSFRLQ